MLSASEILTTLSSKVSPATFEEILCISIQANLYKMATLGTAQKWSSRAGGCLIKYLYKLTTNQMWSVLARF